MLDDAPERRPRHSRTLTESERNDLRYRMVIGCKRAIHHGLVIPADVMAPRSLSNLVKAYGDAEIRDVPRNQLYSIQAECLEAGLLVMVRVGSMCALRPIDFPAYPGESAWELK